MKVFLVIIFLNSCVAFSQNLAFRADLIPANLKENANSIIRLQNISVELKSQTKYIEKTEKIITVFNQNGVSNIDAREYFDKTHEILKMEAIVYDAFGNVLKKIKKSDFREQSISDGFSVITSGRVLFLDYTPTQFPFTIDFKSEVESSNTAFLPKWYPFDDYFESIEKSVFSITYPTDLGFRSKEFNFENYPVQKKEAPNSISYTLENCSADKKEELEPEFSSRVPHVFFSISKFSIEGISGSAQNWKEFGDWMYSKLLQDTEELPLETQEAMKKLVSIETDDIKKAKLIYEYVQNKTRYVSIQLGIGGWKPMLAKDVDRLGYGDCKALTNYTRMLLKSVGITSYYTLINAGAGKKNLEEDFIAMQGNHAVLSLPIDGKLRILECTSQTTPFTFQGDFTDDRKALVVKPNGSELVQTFGYLGADNKQEISGSFTIDDLGNLMGTMNIKSKGIQYNQKFRLIDKSEQEIENFYKTYFSWIENLKIESKTFKNNKDAIEFEENLRITASNYAKTSGEMLLLPINICNQSNTIPQRYRNRKNSFQVLRGFVDEDTIEILLPAGYKINAQPDNFELSEKFGNYRFELKKVTENKVVYKRSLTLLKGNYDKSEYENYRLFREKIARADNSKLVLTK